VVSARAALVPLAAAFACAALGACEMILEDVSPDRHVDPHLDCSGAECVCTGGFGHCVGSVDNGCETDLSTSPSHCGACGAVCDAATHGSCQEGACVCLDGFVDCDGDKTNGCETSAADLVTDPSNCGACGNDCGIGTCTDGVCGPSTLATVPGATGVAAWSDRIFVSVCAPGTPSVVGFTPGQPSSVSAVMATDCAHGLAIAEDRIAWTSDTALFLADGTASGTSTTLASPIHPSPLLAAGSAAIYWWDTPAGAGQHALLRLDLPAGSPASIVQADLGALTADDKAVYWSDGTGIHSVPHTGTTVTDLGGPPLASALASDGFTTLYVGSPQGIQAIPLAGGAPVVLAPAKQVAGLATTEGSVLWADAADGSIRRVAITGGDVSVLVTGQSFVPTANIAVLSRSVYWLANQGSTIVLLGIAL
jgi:hypothetical protein